MMMYVSGVDERKEIVLFWSNSLSLGTDVLCTDGRVAQWYVVIDGRGG